MRILGPPRSRRTPTHLLARCAASRTISNRRRRSSTVPCEALSRTTSSPAPIMSVRTAMSSVAGPTVATIFVRFSMMSGACALLEGSDGRQSLAFDELEEGAAARGDVGDPVLDAILLDRGQRIAAARQRERLAARDRLGNGAGAFAELLVLENPDRAVPDDRPRRLQHPAQPVRRVRSDVENPLVRADLVDRTHVGVRGGRNLLG